jgi:8-oxo-(d)GTP phosphatase
MVRPDLIRAAGALLWRSVPDEPQFGLVHRAARHDWSWPKGKLEPGEHVLLAAVREVAEETGQTVVLGRPLPTQMYRVDGRPKHVRYWTAHAPEPLQSFQPGREVDKVEWLPGDEARATLTYPHDARLLDAFLTGPAQTVPLVLLRHAKAVKRWAWGGTIDQARPLDPTGIEQARRLVPLLAAFGITQIYSSDATRCRDTVLPYARSRGLQVYEEPLLSEDGHDGYPEGARERAEDLLGSTQPLVICSHRPVLPDLLSVLLARWKGKPPRGLAPGSFLVLHRDLTARADGRPELVAVEHHQP